MNAKERMALAMRGEKPDRTPLMCQFSLGYLAQYFTKDLLHYWYTPEGLADAYIDSAREYRFDGILVSVPSRNPDMRNQLTAVEDCPEGGMNVTFDDGRRFYIAPNEWPKRIGPAPVGTGVTEIEDLDVEGIQIQTLEDLPAYQCNILKRILEKAGNEFSVHGETGTCFERFLGTLGSVSNGLVGLMEDGEKAKAAMDRINQNVLLQAREQCKLGVDAFKLSSPYAGAGFISREMYREFVLPYEKELIDMIHREFGIPCYIHTCGAIGDRLDLMLETGTDGLECLDPPPLGTVDLAEASRILGSRAFIKGNLDSVNELRGTTPEQVIEIAERRLQIGRNHPGGFILSTACSIAPDVPPENIHALYDAVTR